MIMPHWKELSQALRNPAYVCFIWFGMTAGVSLLATPIRFTAPLITRPVALDIGRVVFAALNKAELIALLILLIVVRVSGRARELWLQCSALILIVLVQSVWLLPQLAERSQQIISGVHQRAVCALGRLVIIGSWIAGPSPRTSAFGGFTDIRTVARDFRDLTQSRQPLML